MISQIIRRKVIVSLASSKLWLGQTFSRFSTIQNAISTKTKISEWSNQLCLYSSATSCLSGVNKAKIDSTIQFHQQTTTSTIRSLSTHSIDDHEDEDKQHSHSHEPTYTVQVSNNGQCISVTDHNTPTNSWIFVAPLLWVNDPNYIHPSSGQRTRTLGQYHREISIQSGQVLECSLDNIHPAPLPGSFHPRGGIYQFQNHDSCHTTSATTRKVLQIEWKSGEISHYDLFWLVHHANLGRMGSTATMSKEMQVTHSQQAKELAANKRNGHVPLPTACNDTRVTKDIAIRARNTSDQINQDVSTSIPTLEYCNVMEHEEALFHAMQGIYEHGAILLRNAPVLIENDHNLHGPLFQKEQESVVGNLGKKFSGGSLSHGSLYGDIFHVQSKQNAENIAYTNVGLLPHQDLTYYESKPFLQLLHCVSNGSIVGGESVLIDSMAAAEELRRIAPDIFAVLCHTEATFLKERAGADMVTPKPHIRTDPSLGHVVEINWSPPFEGPWQLSPWYAVEDYVCAYQALEIMLNDQWNAESEVAQSLLPRDLETQLREYARQYTWEYALQRGDVLVFNNQRLLHGRREFTAVGDGCRHLIGCYTDAMDTTSRYRQLLRERGGTGGGGYGKRNPGSGCRWL
jgi:alpha-ketoglutarate-dependent taurine dioxygenase